MPFSKFGWLALAAAATLAGCASGDKTESPAAASTAPAATTVPNDGRCHAEGAQFAVGQQGSQALLDQARQRSGSGAARALRPNDMITMDYRSDRLNLYLDGSGKVTRAGCG
ncbi:I78 family peptidase inhibitor [Pseudomonas sp. NPDC007930]|uniref:I78 family peptidase inhibitor n=1 Tax=Pseudomonas sp. NPDC007930 TaxID=3364417 RepID=UPI0036E61CD9